MPVETEEETRKAVLEIIKQDMYNLIEKVVFRFGGGPGDVPTQTDDQIKLLRVLLME